MRRKKIIEAAVVCILLLLLGAYMEFSDRSMDDKNRIIRGSPGSGRQEVELTLNADRKSTRLNSSHSDRSRMPSSA